MSSEYLTRKGQVSIFKDLLYSPDVLKKKTKALDIFNMDKTCLIKISI